MLSVTKQLTLFILWKRLQPSNINFFRSVYLIVSFLESENSIMFLIPPRHINQLTHVPLVGIWSQTLTKAFPKQLYQEHDNKACSSSTDATQMGQSSLWDKLWFLRTQLRSLGRVRVTPMTMKETGAQNIRGSITVSGNKIDGCDSL